jgi:chromosome segregation ATPase
VLYLAEVQKKSGGLMGGNKAELRLLACQRSEQSWNAVPGEEVIPSEEASKYGAGTLVLVDLTANKQVQRVQEAARQLVSILQNFSRLQERFKSQEEEIEQWKQSLTYQSQELNRREMEMETRREQLEQMEEDFEKLEQQRQEIDTLREEVTRQQDGLDRKNQELEGAWEHLRGEMRRLEERQSELQQSARLDEGQAHVIFELLNQLSTSTPPTDELREQTSASIEVITQQQTALSQHWQTLEQQRSTAQQIQAEVDRQAQDTHTRWQEWHGAQASMEQARAELRGQQKALESKREYAQMLNLQIQNHEELHQQIYKLAEGSNNITISSQPIDLTALENKPIEELKKVVQDLEQDLEKLSRFVESQEEELRYKQQEIESLQVKLQEANEFDRLNLENEIADEQDGYQMLNETLVGQRRSLRDRRSILNQHQMVLRRRQGLPIEAGQESSIDLSPLIGQIEAQRQQKTEELQKLESQIEQMQAAISQAETMVATQVSEQENKRNELKQLEQTLLSRRAEASESWGKVNLYQEMLQPWQDSVDRLRQSLEGLSSAASQAQTSSEQQQQAIAEMRQILVSLTGTPELAAS